MLLIRCQLGDTNRRREWWCGTSESMLSQSKWKPSHRAYPKPNPASDLNRNCIPGRRSAQTGARPRMPRDGATLVVTVCTVITQVSMGWLCTVRCALACKPYACTLFNNDLWLYVELTSASVLLGSANTNTELSTHNTHKRYIKQNTFRGGFGEHGRGEHNVGAGSATYAMAVEFRCGASSKSTPPIGLVTPWCCWWCWPTMAMALSMVSPSPKPSNDSPSDSEEHCDFGASVWRIEATWTCAKRISNRVCVCVCGCCDDRLLAGRLGACMRHACPRRQRKTGFALGRA